MSARPRPDLLCPLCGGANACTPAHTGRFDDLCWCQGATFSAELLARVPEPLRGVACVCAACAAADIQTRAALG